MYDATESIINAFTIGLFQKTIAAGCFYDYLDSCPAWTIPFQGIVLRSRIMESMPLQNLLVMIRLFRLLGLV